MHSHKSCRNTTLKKTTGVLTQGLYFLTQEQTVVWYLYPLHLKDFSLTNQKILDQRQSVRAAHRDFLQKSPTIVRLKDPQGTTNTTSSSSKEPIRLTLRSRHLGTRKFRSFNSEIPTSNTIAFTLQITGGGGGLDAHL